MKKQWLAITITVTTATTALFVLFWWMGDTASGISSPALAAPAEQGTLASTVTAVDPAVAPNDLDTPIVITGTVFTTVPTVTLGSTVLEDVGWVSGERLTASVPWGLDLGVYTLTVTNPDSESGRLPGAFTVTQGIGVWNAGEQYGGNINQVVVNPMTPTTVYAASVDVGLFRSRDGGESWSFVYAPGARRVAMDPITPTTIYWSSNGSFYRSDDEGDTWIPLGPEEGQSAWQAAYPHPTEPDTVYFSSQSSEHGGLLKSTDRGQTWVTMTNGLTDTGDILAFHPTDPMTMALATSNGHVFHSTDGGEMWAYSSTPVDYPSSLAFNPWKDNELWISAGCFSGDDSVFKNTTVSYTEWISMALHPMTDIDFAPPGWGSALSSTVFAAGCFNEAYKTTDSGDTWENFGPLDNAGNSIALHPTDPNTIYSASQWYGVFKTTNGGDTWQVVQEGLTAVVPRQLASVPGQPDVVYALTDRPEGIYKSTDGGRNWKFIPVTLDDDRMAIRFSSLAVDPFTQTRVYASLSGTFAARIHVSEDGGETWPRSVAITATEQYSDCSGLGLDVLLAHPTQRGLLLAGVNYNYQDWGFFYNLGTIYRSTDHGEHWTRMSVTQEISGVNDIAFDTLTPTIVYAVTGGAYEKEGSGIFRSTDSGQRWARVGAGEPAMDCVRHLAVERDSDHRVFAWTCSDGLYVSHNQGITWTRAVFNWPAGGWVDDMISTDDDPSVLYAATGSGLFRTENGGETWWTQAAGALGQVPIHSLATVTAADRVILYAGTAGGYVESGAAQALDLANNDGTLVNAGVYRFTTRRIWQMYLPRVLRANIP